VGTEVDDTTAALSTQVGEGCLIRKEGASEVDIEHLIPLKVGDFGGRHSAFDTRCIHESVEAAQLAHGLIE
jgi:hypothetical protein